MNKPVVDFICSERPDPLETRNSGCLMVAIRPAETEAYCNEIVLSVPCGESSDAIFSTESSKPVISTSSPYWTMLGMKMRESKDEPTWYDFTVQCREPSKYKLDYALVFQISGRVNQSPGTATVELVATCSPDGKIYEDTDVCTLIYHKVCAKFYLKNFSASDMDAPLIPCTEFSRKSKIRLSWESNGSYFRVYAGKEVVYDGKDTYCVLSKILKKDTTFFLSASLVELNEFQAEDNDFLPIYLYENLSVTISDPELEVSKLHAGELNAVNFTSTGQTDLSGQINVTGSFHCVGGHKILEPNEHLIFNIYIATTDLLVIGYPKASTPEKKNNTTILQDGMESTGKNFVCSLIRANRCFYLISLPERPITYEAIFLGQGEIKKYTGNETEMKELSTYLTARQNPDLT